MKKVIIVIITIIQILILQSCEVELIDRQIHEHNYVDGSCSCGETDPNYHEHNFINGKCECGKEEIIQIIKGIEEPFISNTNINLFYELCDNKIIDVKNVLPLWIIEKYNINVFQKSDNSNAYLMYNEKIIQLYPWSNSDSDGVVHICVEDINEDNYIELYISLNYNNDSDFNLAKVCVFDTKSQTLVETLFNHVENYYFDYENNQLKASEYLSFIKRDVKFEFEKLEYYIKTDTFEAIVNINPDTCNFPISFVSEKNSFCSTSIEFNIKTKYIGETYSYMGSSTVYGAIPSLYNESNLYYPFIGVTDDYTNVKIEHNMEFEDTYNIIFYKSPNIGNYNLMIEYHDETIVLENAISIVNV